MRLNPIKYPQSELTKIENFLDKNAKITAVFIKKTPKNQKK
jgi:hypothetical protein